MKRSLDDGILFCMYSAAIGSWRVPDAMLFCCLMQPISRQCSRFLARRYTTPLKGITLVFDLFYPPPPCFAQGSSGTFCND